MAERRKRKCLEVNSDYVFDGLLIYKLQQAYEILVPDNCRTIGNQMELVVTDNEDSCNSRQRCRNLGSPMTNHKPALVRIGKTMSRSR
jgi:hypothetical protein